MLRHSRHEVSGVSLSRNAYRGSTIDSHPTVVPTRSRPSSKVRYSLALRIGLLLVVGLISILLLTNQYRSTTAQSLEEGLVLWLKLDEGVGNIASDSSGNNNSGILRGGDWVLGRFGNAVDLINPSQNNIQADWIQIPPAENQNLDRQVTLAAWIKPIQLDDGSGIITKGESITSYAMRLTDSGQVRFTANFGEPFGWQGTGDWDSFKTISINEWHHIAVTYDGANVRFYLDGVKDNNKPAVDLVFGRATQPIFIGADLPDDDQLFDGSIDDVRIYDRALSASEIERLAVPANQSPSLTLPETQQSLEGDSIALTIQAADPEGQAVAFSIGGLPRGLTFNASTGLISGIIDQGTVGTYSVDVDVTDPQNNRASGSFLWKVQAPAPTSTPTERPTVPPTDTPIDTPIATPTGIPTSAPNTPTDVPTPTSVTDPTAKPPTDTPAPGETAIPTPSTIDPTVEPTVAATVSSTVVSPSPTAAKPDNQQFMGQVRQTFRHFEDAQLDNRIGTGDRILFRTTITNTGQVTLTNIQVSQEANPELSLVPDSLWVVQDESNAGTQIANAKLPLNVAKIPVGASVSILYVMEVRLSPAINAADIESIAFVQVSMQEAVYAPPLSVPVVRPPVGLSNNSSRLLFLPLIE